MAAVGLAVTLIRDKFYLQATNGWLFNVTGYEHPSDRYYASLKYVDGKKWKRGYRAARDFLLDKEVPFVDDDGYICVPEEEIDRVFDPFARWQEMRDDTDCSDLHVEALQLADRVAAVMGIDSTAFGITDSLLWGEGHVASDLDLVVLGRENAERLSDRLPLLYQQADFTRPDPEVVRSPYGTSIAGWPEILRKKWHMGCFRGRPFSLRVVWREEEVPPGRDWEHRGQATIVFRVDDARDAFVFPAVYYNSAGDELVDYSVVYEGVFRPGDVVTCRCEHLTGARAGDSSPVNRYVLQEVVEAMCGGRELGSIGEA